MARAALECSSVVELYDSGFSLSETARLVDMPMSTVHSILKRQGVKMRPVGGQNVGMGDRVDHKAVAKTVLLYRSGYSTNEIAAMLGISHSSVAYRLKLAGEPRRSRAEAIRIRKQRAVVKQAEAMAAMYLDNHSQESVAQHFNVSRAVVKHRLKMLGVPIRARTNRA